MASDLIRTRKTGAVACTQDADTDSNHPLLKMPREFELVWVDESAPRDKCLAVWKPVPMPGCAVSGPSSAWC